VLELCAQNGISAEVCDLSLAEVYRADEMFCTGTMGELALVDQVDGRTIGMSNTQKPVYQRLAELFRELTKTEGTSVVD
jgi:branched-chain amino acid aminotransferase